MAVAGTGVRGWRRLVLVGCGLSLVAGLAVVTMRLAGGGGSGGASPYGTSVPVGSAPARQPGRVVMPAAKLTGWRFPAGGQGQVRLDGGPVDIGGVGVRLASAGARLTAAATGSGSALVRVLGQGPAVAAGVRGVLVTLSPGALAGRTVRASFDYSSFANVYGANFGLRLRAFALPGCALTTPAVRACQARTLLPGGVNNGRLVSADLALPLAGGGRGAAAAAGGTTVIALASTSYSDSGTFTATTLSQAYSWSAGDQGGTFTTSYPLRAPASLGGPSPQLALRYDSGGVDSETLAQNSQPSWAGEGWDLQTGFIERSYRGCSASGGTFPATPDLCLYSPNDVTMVFGGRSARLVWDSTAKAWHPSDDTAIKVEQLKGTGAANAPGSVSDSLCAGLFSVRI